MKLVNPRSRLLYALWLAILLGGTACLGPGVHAQSPRPSGGETVDVDLRTVPFYAVDRLGHPIYDLKPYEIEMRVDDQPVKVRTFDHWRMDRVSALTSSHSDAPKPRRHIFLLIDQAFTQPGTLRQIQGFTGQLLSDFPTTDYLHLITHHSQTGFAQVLGPLQATEKNRTHVRQVIELLKPNVGRPHLYADSDLPPPGPQQWYRQVEQGGMHSGYGTTARTYANALKTFAAASTRLNGPKVLLVFGDGILEQLYERGDAGLWPAVGAAQGTQEAYQDPVRYSLKSAFQALAAAGVTPFFVTLDKSRVGGRSMLRQMSAETGGLFLTETQPAALRRRIAQTLASYYEAGFYTEDGSPIEQATRVEILVRRPGVEVVSPRWLRVRDAYRNLSIEERELQVVDFIFRGTRGVFTGVVQLPGDVIKGTESSPNLRIAADWPASLTGKMVDLFEVGLHFGAKGGELLHFKRRELRAATEPLRFDRRAPRDGIFVWGVVAVDPESGRAFYRRVYYRGAPAVEEVGRRSGP